MAAITRAAIKGSNVLNAYFINRKNAAIILGVYQDTVDLLLNAYDKEEMEYVKDAYTSIVTQSKSITFSNEVKRYLNISLSKKIDQQFPKLSKWEKLFVFNSFYCWIFGSFCN